MAVQPERPLGAMAGWVVDVGGNVPRAPVSIRLTQSGACGHGMVTMAMIHPFLVVPAVREPCRRKWGKAGG